MSQAVSNTNTLYKQVRHILEMGGGLFTRAYFDRYGASGVRDLTNTQLAEIVGENPDLLALENPFSGN